VSRAQDIAAIVRRVADPTDRSNRLLVTGIGAVALAMSLASLNDLLRSYPRGVDLDIALDAAKRWLAGGQPYLAGDFSTGSSNPPFLYPPYALVLFAPLTAIARLPLQAIWFVLGVTLAFAAVRRLGISRWLIPLTLVWPPFAEALAGGNVQIGIFTAFVFLFFGSPPSGPREGGTDQGQAGQPLWRGLLGRGLLGAVTAFLKVSQPHVIVHLIRREPRAAVVAVVAILALALMTLPVTGSAAWQAWIAQLQRAADPAWAIGGSSVARLLPRPFDTAFLAACLVAVLALPPARAAEWVGVLLVLGSPGLRTYYFLFLLPAMLRMRREVALGAAFFLATYTQQGWWLGIALVTGALALSTIQGRSRPA